MKAAVLRGKLDLGVEDVPMPHAEPGGLLVRVHAATICGSDVRSYKNGRANVDQGHPLIMGHEFAGDIVEVGEGTHGFEVGQRVSLAPNFGCGTCDLCVSGQTNACHDYRAFGISIPGAFAHYVAIPHEAVRQGNVYVLRDGTSYEEAALIEPLSTVLNGQKRMAAQPGSDVLVIGAGPIGIMHAMVAQLLGAGRVFMNDLNHERLMHACELLGDVEPIEGDVASELHARTGSGVDACIVAASSPMAQAQSLEYMNTNGRLLFFGGLPTGSERVSIDANLIHYRQLAIFGCTGQTLENYRASARLVESGRVKLSEVITDRCSIDDFPMAMEDAAAGKGLKRALVFE
ncbi:MAG: alcohol dehydrogenase catalytic domain-containing protein [Tractidigestivibacter sp.]|jgi:L-iditol 2-dehydrogenase|uniref:alcohol dehydrogenase catalytic domain-containing protein n=1 Tax=Tractidigestivibacter sp. TaxID=2847320 RepID=UPI003D89F415